MSKSISLVFFTFFFAHTVFSQCSVSQYIQDNYAQDARILAMRDILDDPTDPDHFNPFIPQSRSVPYLEKISAIYENPNNEPAIDDLFNFFDIHVNQEYNYSIEFKTIGFSVDTNVSWVEDFKNTGVSGLVELDQLMSDFQFQIHYFVDLSKTTLFTIKTDFEFLNLNAIISDFEGIEDLNYANISHDNIHFRLNYTGIPYVLEGWDVQVSDIIINEDIFTFCIYSGDCFAGCLHSRCWNIQVSEDCEVTLLSNPENEINQFSIYPNPVSQQLYIANINSGIEAIQIYSLEGKLIKSERSKTKEVDVSSLQNGIYFMEITTSKGGKQIHKFVKK